jgi:hypothetical protein
MFQNFIYCFTYTSKTYVIKTIEGRKGTLACVHLHNYLRSALSKNSYNPHGTFYVEHLEIGTIKQCYRRNEHQELQSF